MDFGRVQFGRRANRRFNYRPVYYDEDKEDLQDRVEKARMKATGTYRPEGFKERIKNGYKYQLGAYSTPYHMVASGSKARFLFILIIVGLTFYLAFYSQVFSVIFEAFYNA